MAFLVHELRPLVEHILRNLDDLSHFGAQPVSFFNGITL